MSGGLNVGEKDWVGVDAPGGNIPTLLTLRFVSGGARLFSTWGMRRGMVPDPEGHGLVEVSQALTHVSRSALPPRPSVTEETLPFPNPGLREFPRF